MTSLFLKILDMSITACWLILAVFIVRVVLKKAPKTLRCILWAFVGIKLIVPIQFESIFSLIPKSIPIVENSGNSTILTFIENSTSIVDSNVNPIIKEPISMISTKWTVMDVLPNIAAILWCIGVLSMLMYCFISYAKLKRETEASLPFKENVYFCDEIESAFILGIIKPKIYLPSSISLEHIEPILAHEKSHLKRKDHVWKFLGFIVLTLHWFNPFVWVAYVLFGRDVELACDESVIKKMEDENKKEYCHTLMDFNKNNRLLLVCPLAFGEIGVKERIKQIVNYKKPSFWIIVISFVICVVTVVGFMSESSYIYLHDIKEEERMDYSTLFENVKYIEFSDQNFTYTSLVNDEVNEALECLQNLKVVKKPILKERSRERERAYRIILKSNTSSTILYFDENFKTVWMDLQSTASYTYKIQNNKELKELFIPLIADTSSTEMEAKYNIDAFITYVDEDRVILSGIDYKTQENNGEYYIDTKNLEEKTLSLLKEARKARVFFNTLKKDNEICEIEQIYLLNNTYVYGEVKESKILEEELLTDLVKQRVDYWNQLLEDSFYSKYPCDYESYQYIHVFYDEEESQRITEELTKEFADNNQYFVILERYYGKDILSATQQCGWGYVLYSYEEIEGEMIVKELNTHMKY